MNAARIPSRGAAPRNVGRASSSGLIVGGEPRANLLPPEVGMAAKGRTARRIMVMITLLVVAMVVGASILAFLGAQQSHSSLDIANARTAELLAEQSKYVEVQNVTAMVRLAESARYAMMVNEVDWPTYIRTVAAALPASAKISQYTVNSETPMTPFPPPSGPLQSERVASITVNALTQTLPDIKAWLVSLQSLKGYADAWPGTVTLGEEGYQVDITIHVNMDALTNRFPDPSSVTGGK